MKKHKLPKEGFERVSRQIKKFTLVLIFFIYIIPFGLLMDYTAGDFNPLLIMIPIIGIGTYFGFRRNMKSQKEAWNSYELIIKEKEIIQTQNNREAIIIDKTEITEILNKNDFLVLKTGNVFRMLSIPQEIEQYDEIVAMLTEIKPITQQSKQENKLLILKVGGFSIGMVSLMFVFFTSQKLATLLLAGSIFIGMLIWSIIVIQKGNIDKSVKLYSFAVILVIVSILGKIYHQLF